MRKAVFDPYQWDVYYSDVSRMESEDTLRHREVGSFLVRPSSTQQYNFSLSLRCYTTGSKQIFHYLIDNVELEGEAYFKVNGKLFTDMNSIISHYKMTPLLNTKLITPTPKTVLRRVICVWKFNGEEDDDLPFNEREELEIIRVLSGEEGWGVARNALGIVGMIPYNYIVDKDVHDSMGSRRVSRPRSFVRKDYPKLPAVASVTSRWRPNLFDTESIRLKKDALVVVTHYLPTGECNIYLRSDPEVKGKISMGQLKFTKLPLVKSESEDRWRMRRPRKPTTIRRQIYSARISADYT